VGHTPGVMCDCIHVLTRSWLNLAAICAHILHTCSKTSSARRAGNASLHRCLQYSLKSQWSLNLPQHLSAMVATSLSSDSCPTVRFVVIISMILNPAVFSCIHKQCKYTVIFTITVESCEISSSHGGKQNLLGCTAVFLIECWPTFQWFVLPPSSGWWWWRQHVPLKRQPTFN
jgi:hypothetical protein